jgi:hypothetical protein
MAYLDTKYGDYSKWNKVIDSELGISDQNDSDNKATANEIRKVMIAAYGTDPIGGFYGWIKKNDSNYSRSIYLSLSESDLTKLKYVDILPSYASQWRYCCLGESDSDGIKYKNLVVGLDKAKNYLKKYKKENISKIKLRVSPDVKLTFYDSAGKYIGSSYGKEEVSVKGISYVKLNGQGKTKFELINFTNDKFN